MKRLAMATVLLTAVAVGAQAGSFPKPIRLVDQMKMYSPTHYVRGPEKGKARSGSASSTAEVRPATPAPNAAEKQKPEPKPARAD